MQHSFFPDIRLFETASQQRNHFANSMTMNRPLHQGGFLQD